jgi:hypothetical protein
VTGELEKRWETASQELQKAEDAWLIEERNIGTSYQIDSEIRRALMEAG